MGKYIIELGDKEKAICEQYINGKLSDELGEHVNITELADAIAFGTPLPEGHGRLIEEPTETDISNTVGGNNDFAECIRDSVKAVFDNAITIVEADKESEADND